MESPKREYNLLLCLLIFYVFLTHVSAVKELQETEQSKTETVKELQETEQSKSENDKIQNCIANVVHIYPGKFPKYNFLYAFERHSMAMFIEKINDINLDAKDYFIVLLYSIKSQLVNVEIKSPTAFCQGFVEAKKCSDALTYFKFSGVIDKKVLANTEGYLVLRHMYLNEVRNKFDKNTQINGDRGKLYYIKEYYEYVYRIAEKIAHLVVLTPDAHCKNPELYF